MRHVTRGRKQGKPYSELILTPVEFRAVVKNAGRNPNSPCERGTYQEVAFHAGLATHGVIGFLATGKRRTCSPQFALGIARAVGWSYDALFVTKVSPLAGRSVAREQVPA